MDPIERKQLADEVNEFVLKITPDLPALETAASKGQHNMYSAYIETLVDIPIPMGSPAWKAYAEASLKRFIHAEKQFIYFRLEQNSKHPPTAPVAPVGFLAHVKEFFTRKYSKALKRYPAQVQSHLEFNNEFIRIKQGTHEEFSSRPLARQIFGRGDWKAPARV